MKLKHIYFFLIPSLLVLLVVTAFRATVSEEETANNAEIIKFSHSFHAELAECADCHIQVVNSTSLKDRLMPNHESCQSCHDVEDEENCTTCHFEDKFEPLIQKEETELIFDHSYHISVQNTECKTCHEGFTEVDYSHELASPNPVMADCYTCHNNEPGSLAANECESCHISTANLKPESHLSAMFIDQHKFSALNIGADCIMCHDNNTCEECHIASGITAANIASDFYQPYTPSNFTDGVKQQRINRVHDLSYRFTHGMDAKSKRFDCQSCHETETFCAVCHTSEGHDFALGGIMPASHLKNNFFTIGAGSGGGEHALLARRDIESCVSCHDVQGADPTCISCHLDADGIKGNNPKTHPTNFMRDEKGDWHSDQGSVCYNCHSSASPSTPAGIGFCGYCHGAI